MSSRGAGCPIADRSFSADRSLLAIARDSRVRLCARSVNGFALQDELAGHNKTVTSVDVAPRSGNIIVICNALVCEPSPTGWKPTLVLLRIINRAATTFAGRPDETICLPSVGSGARVIAVSKHLKKLLHSTVLSVNWHLSSALLVAGSAGAHARVFSAFIKERLPFNTMHLHVAVHQLIWTREDQIVAAGHDGHPVVFQDDMNGGWTQAYSVDDPSQRQGSSEADESSALNMFRQMDLKGRTSSVDDTNLKTIHQNTISHVTNSAPLGISHHGPHQLSRFFSVDGRIFIFPVASKQGNQVDWDRFPD
ncbi:hypothetical protein FN846DRAFT_1027946 [Sphaerosporella brunnea]|uniref:WD40-repeat-containing domain protein n=1 Tax=Sphaerosporella brunnea TaxID=1250544 RepID=A0A5J5EY40_9PEZI|nr:hypothetical protein FN846DRAFT_1027946 [Sphaerosporella brunnea]